MIPNNPPDSDRQQQIVTIVDKNNVNHKVIPVNHKHSQSEVSGLTTALAGKQNALTFDTTPTANSTNPVTSGGVKTALDGKQGTLTFDTTPTANSTNPVTSGGVYDAIDGLRQDTDHYLEGKQDALTFDTTPTANSTNPVTSGGVKAAIDALLTNYIPIHQVAAILPNTRGQGSEQELQGWLGDGKMALVLQTARPVEVNIEATGVDNAPDGTWRGSTDISFDLEQGIRTVKNIYDLMYAQLQNDYPGERIGTIENWKIRVYAKDTVIADTACLINFYNTTIDE